MFDTHRIRQNVTAKVREMRNPTEEQIHDAYSREILAELHKAREDAEHLQTFLASAPARHPSKGWIMIPKEDIEHYTGLVTKFLSQFVW